MANDRARIHIAIVLSDAIDSMVVVQQKLPRRGGTSCKECGNYDGNPSKVLIADLLKSLHIKNLCRCIAVVDSDDDGGLLKRFEVSIADGKPKIREIDFTCYADATNAVVDLLLDRFMGLPMQSYQGNSLSHVSR